MTTAPKMTASQIETATAYAIKSQKHADYLAAMLTGKAQADLAYLPSVLEVTAERVLSELAPKRRYVPSESREVNGYAVDKGEDN